jgi:FtsP/CotA-like multicopper oxidase with cupredoxin domain
MQARLRDTSLKGHRMRRRHFLGLSAAAIPAARLLHARVPKVAERSPLIIPPEWQPDGKRLVGMQVRTEIATGRQANIWTVTPGDRRPTGVTMRARMGETARVTFENRLDQTSILHWHGLHLPEAADGHPSLAIGKGEQYRYEFEVTNRAGTYWYHSHPHMMTGEQVYRGMAGLFLINDAEEDALNLPSGVRELPLLLGERRFDAAGEFAFNPVMHERMEGFFGSDVFVNGIQDPTHNVDSALYRLRVVNATPSRIHRVGLSTGAQMTLIGVDGGLLPAPTKVDYVELGTGERADLLVDFSGMPVGTKVMLKSLPYTPPYQMAMGMGMGRMGAGGKPQGVELDLLEFVVTKAVTERPWAARRFPTIIPIDPASASRTRPFSFESAMMQHTINGKPFAMDRIDEVVPFGATEIWRFTNPAQFPHPVHMHEVQFQVLSRTGGRAMLFPWERGWKDTVMVFPGETVEVIATFNRHRGRYLMHCHNLVHEDGGMMMNYEIR